MTEGLGRRQFLIVVGGALVQSCGGATSEPPQPGKPCHTTAIGPGLGYCLVESEVLRVPNATQLDAGRGVLFNVDDNSAVIVARDQAGFYALSAICTHQCCLVSICGDSACGHAGTNPGSCRSTALFSLERTGGAFVCPCHGSAFKADGSVINGPARRALPSLTLVFDGADVLVDLSQSTSPAARVQPA